MENKSIFYIVSVLFSSLLVNGCYAEKISKPDDGQINCVKAKSTETRKIVIDFIIDPFAPSFKRTGISKSYITDRFGKYTIQSTNNYIPHYREPGETYEIQSEVWEFSGTELKVEKMMPSAKNDKNPYWIDKIVVNSDKYKFKLPVKIGSSLKQIYCQLGKSLNNNVKESRKLKYSTVGVKEYGDLTIYLDSKNNANKFVFEYFSD